MGWGGAERERERCVSNGPKQRYVEVMSKPLYRRLAEKQPDLRLVVGKGDPGGLNTLALPEHVNFPGTMDCNRRAIG